MDILVAMASQDSLHSHATSRVSEVTGVDEVELRRGEGVRGQGGEGEGGIPCGRGRPLASTIHLDT